MLHKTPKVDFTDGVANLPKSLIQLHLASYFFDHSRRNVEGFDFPLPSHRQEELEMQLFALCTTAVGFATFPSPFHERARKHFPQGGKASDECTARLQLWVNSFHHLAYIILPDSGNVKPLSRFAKMTRNGLFSEDLADADLSPHLWVGLRKRSVGGEVDHIVVALTDLRAKKCPQGTRSVTFLIDRHMAQ